MNTKNRQSPVRGRPRRIKALKKRSFEVHEETCERFADAAKEKGVQQRKALMEAMTLWLDQEAA
jgi:hypothetical protein